VGAYEAPAAAARSLKRTRAPRLTSAVPLFDAEDVVAVEVVVVVAVVAVLVAVDDAVVPAEVVVVVVRPWSTKAKLQGGSSVTLA